MKSTRFAVLSLLCLSLPAAAYAEDELDDVPPIAAPAPPPVAPTAPRIKSQAVKPAPALGKTPATAPPEPEVEQPPPAAIGAMNDMAVAELQALDKITARVSNLEIKIGETTTFGSLTVSVKACRKSPPENTPESAVFLQVWEQKPGEDSHWVYSGWMFASSPALAAMDHPVYDIWLVDCKKESTSTASSTSPATPPPAAPAK